MKVLLISTYDLGHQPFGLASPSAWLRQAGASVTCLDLSIQELQEESVRQAELVAFYLPMHTATRLAVRVLKRVQHLNPGCHICFFGLYAVLNANYLLKLGAHTILGGEHEEELVRLVQRLADPEKAWQGREQAAAPVTVPFLNEPWYC